MKPPRNPHYLAWIRTLPCVVCGSTGWIEASHTGPHGLGQKSSDYSAIPLCAKHHRTGERQLPQARSSKVLRSPQPGPPRHRVPLEPEASGAIGSPGAL